MIIESIKETLKNEGNAIINQIDGVGKEFEDAVQLIASSKGKIVVVGVGKSGIIGRKISATLASTGTPSFFVHPTDAFHGDLGMITKEEIVLALSNSGETDEVLKIIPFFKENKNPIISITNNSHSTLAVNSDIHLTLHIKNEACPLNLAPTTSSTVTLAYGDALAIAIMKVKNFKQENYARFHPGGSLGRRLLLKVGKIMRTHDLPIISPDSNLQDVINAMSYGKLGLALVNENDISVGIVTDGDLRRLMERKGKDAFDMKAREIMTVAPKTIGENAALTEAEALFNKFKINSLVVTDNSNKTIGVVQIYDLKC